MTPLTSVMCEVCALPMRLLGNPADGTAKFQYGWEESTDASDAARYWVGLYDVTNSGVAQWRIQSELLCASYV